MSKMSRIHYTDFNALKAMYVEGVEDVKSVADPGFPRGGGANIRFRQIFPKTA